MSKSLDDLARNLVSGVSRRKAFWQVFTSLGIVAALTGRKASAQSGQNSGCARFCEQQAALLEEMCTTASKHCPPGSCAEVPFNCDDGTAFISGTCVLLGGSTGG
jgi:hypothetical protein